MKPKYQVFDLNNRIDTSKVYTLSPNKVYNPNKKYKWTDVYSSEEEMLVDLKEVDIDIGEYMVNWLYPVYKGYEFIHSFARQLQAGKVLSPKQITQCKRLATQIKIANNYTKLMKKANNL